MADLTVFPPYCKRSAVLIGVSRVVPPSPLLCVCDDWKVSCPAVPGTVVR